MQIAKIRKILNSWSYLVLIVLIYLGLFIFRPDIFLLSLDFFLQIIIKIIPVLTLVFGLMILTNYFITPQLITHYFKVRGIKKWLIVIISGTLSTGPIYVWYPFLAELKNKGLNYGFIACFLYNWSIKISLLPIMIFYFNLNYVAILYLTMIIASIVALCPPVVTNFLALVKTLKKSW
jgi:hypothetical protein